MVSVLRKNSVELHKFSSDVYRAEGHDVKVKHTEDASHDGMEGLELIFQLVNDLVNKCHSLLD